MISGNLCLIPTKNVHLGIKTTESQISQAYGILKRGESLCNDLLKRDEAMNALSAASKKFEKLKRYSLALKAEKLALGLTNEKDFIHQASRHNCIATFNLKLNPPDKEKALNHFVQAEEFYEKVNGNYLVAINNYRIPDSAAVQLPGIYIKSQAYCAYNAGKLLAEKHHYNEAITYYQKTLDYYDSIQDNMLGKSYSQRIKSIKGLAWCHERLGNDYEAKAWHSRI